MTRILFHLNFHIIFSRYSFLGVHRIFFFGFSPNRVYIYLSFPSLPSFSISFLFTPFVYSTCSVMFLFISQRVVAFYSFLRSYLIFFLFRFLVSYDFILSRFQNVTLLFSSFPLPPLFICSRLLHFFCSSFSLTTLIFLLLFFTCYTLFLLHLFLFRSSTSFFFFSSPPLILLYCFFFFTSLTSSSSSTYIY